MELKDLLEAPKEIKDQLDDHRLRPHILKYLLWRKTMSTAAVGREVRVYADEEEQKAMALCHPRSIEVLKKLIGTITQRSLFRALDVAGGDGRL